MSINAIISRFAKSGDLGHLSAAFHALSREQKLAVVDMVANGEKGEMAVEKVTRRDAAEIARMKVGQVFYSDGERYERVDGRRFHKRYEFHREQVELFGQGCGDWLSRRQKAK